MAAASNRCKEADALLSHRPVQNRGAKEGKQEWKMHKQKEREVRMANQGGGTKRNNEEDIKKFTKYQRKFFLVCLLDIQADNGLATRRSQVSVCHVLHLVSFPA